MTRTKTILKWSFVALCAAMFLLIAFNLDKAAVDALNSGVYSVIRVLKSDFADSYFKLTTQFSGTFALVAFSIIAVLVFYKKRYWASICLNLSLAFVLYLCLKTLFARERPSGIEQLVHENSFSFPSAHAMISCAFFGYLIFIIAQTCAKPRVRTALGALCVFLIFNTCVSRIYLGAHYTSDVLAGLFAGLAYLITYISVIKRYFKEGEREMDEKNTSKKRQQLSSSFKHAFEGIAGGIKGERNMIIHFAAMALVILFAAVLKISAGEWCVCIVLFALVLAAELINTAIEATVDIAMPDVDPRAKLAKDTAAGAVLVCAIASVCAGLIIFLPKIIAVVLSQL